MAKIALLLILVHIGMIISCSSEEDLAGTSIETSSIQGRVIDLDGNGVANIPVYLGRVDLEGAYVLAESLSDSLGFFVLDGEYDADSSFLQGGWGKTGFYKKTSAIRNNANYVMDSMYLYSVANENADDYVLVDYLGKVQKRDNLWYLPSLAMGEFLLINQDTKAIDSLKILGDGEYESTINFDLLRQDWLCGLNGALVNTNFDQACIYAKDDQYDFGGTSESSYFLDGGALYGSLSVGNSDETYTAYASISIGYNQTFYQGESQGIGLYADIPESSRLFLVLADYSDDGSSMLIREVELSGRGLDYYEVYWSEFYMPGWSTSQVLSTEFERIELLIWEGEADVDFIAYNFYFIY
jgi:hypothetical protein